MKHQELAPGDIFKSLSLEQLKNAPRAFYIHGDASLLTSGKRVAIIGSRKASDDGILRAQALAKLLVQQGVIVVSGLAEGIDTAAHQSAIKNEGRTIGVIGTPLDRFYPSQNQALQQEIAEKHLLLSQFPKGERISRSNFPARNKTMALISDATVIVEASDHSGVLHQAREVLRLGRALYIMASTASNSHLVWPREFISQGAKILNREGVQEMLETLSKL